jgi:Cdc6-like AAA superfamily ATPase
LKAFYTNITKFPIPDHYASSGGDHWPSNDEEWNIKIGDTVAVHVGSYGKERKRKNSASVLNHPFTVPWWAAEVVAIYRKLKSTAEAMEFKKGTASQESHPAEHEGDFVVELRWMYTRDLIPGIMMEKVDKTNKNSSDSDCLPLDEVFESDHIEEAGIMSLLAPIAVHPEPFVDQQDSLPHVKNGLPLVHYYCKRLWSVRHKTLAPIGSLEKRQERGMLHSSYMNRGNRVRVAFEEWNNMSNCGSGTESDSLNNQDLMWKDIFHETISKLNLGQSSSLQTGDTLIGREKEQEQIKNFLRSAIDKVNTTTKEVILNSNLFSLFVAGPPGTGKTASVCSVIETLKREQAEGKIGVFDVVYLNGLEMRHPFDAYVQLWKAISKNKETCSAPKALANLEIYLTNKSNNSKPEEAKDEHRRTIVLVMDEVDYLQTRKETVLYNIFEWPHRGYRCKSRAQLIVIGISNTMNLPEKLNARMQSRLGRQRCMFNSYGVKESVDILKGKLLLSKTEGRTIFHPDAITFAARKIASESGDIPLLMGVSQSLT